VEACGRVLRRGRWSGRFGVRAWLHIAVPGSSRRWRCRRPALARTVDRACGGSLRRRSGRPAKGRGVARRPDAGREAEVGVRWTSACVRYRRWPRGRLWRRTERHPDRHEK